MIPTNIQVNTSENGTIRWMSYDDYKKIVRAQDPSHITELDFLVKNFSEGKRFFIYSTFGFQEMIHDNELFISWHQHLFTQKDFDELCTKKYSLRQNK